MSSNFHKRLRWSLVSALAEEARLILSLCMHQLGPSKIQNMAYHDLHGWGAQKITANGFLHSRCNPSLQSQQRPKLSNMKKIVWRWSTFSQTARSYSQYIFLRFLVLFVVRFPSRSYSEISVLKTLLHFRILFRAAAHLKRRVRRDI